MSQICVKTLVVKDLNIIHQRQSQKLRLTHSAGAFTTETIRVAIARKNQSEIVLIPTMLVTEILAFVGFGAGFNAIHADGSNTVTFELANGKIPMGSDDRFNIQLDNLINTVSVYTLDDDATGSAASHLAFYDRNVILTGQNSREKIVAGECLVNLQKANFVLLTVNYSDGTNRKLDANSMDCLELYQNQKAFFGKTASGVIGFSDDNFYLFPLNDVLSYTITTDAGALYIFTTLALR